MLYSLLLKNVNYKVLRWVTIINFILSNLAYIILIIVIIFYAIVGYINGFRKTLFYIIADLIIATILLIALSFVTIQKYYTTENLLKILETIFIIPNNIQQYFLSPDLQQIVYIITDIVVRLILFVGIYPLTRFILKHTLFRKIIKTINNGYKKTKKARVYGSLIGSFKGLIIGVVIILPVILYNPIVSEESLIKEEVEIYKIY